MHSVWLELRINLSVGLLYMSTNRKTGETSGKEAREALVYDKTLHQYRLLQMKFLYLGMYCA